MQLTPESDEILNVGALVYTSIVLRGWNRDHCWANLVTGNRTLIALDGLVWSVFTVTGLEEVSSPVTGQIATVTLVLELPISLRFTRAKFGGNWYIEVYYIRIELAVAVQTDGHAPHVVLLELCEVVVEDTISL